MVVTSSCQQEYVSPPAPYMYNVQIWASGHDRLHYGVNALTRSVNVISDTLIYLEVQEGSVLHLKADSLMVGVYGWMYPTLLKGEKKIAL